MRNIYPKDILPQENYRVIKNNDIPKLVDSFFIRNSLLNKDKMYKSNKKIRFDCIVDLNQDQNDWPHFFTLSWNLLGIYKKKYLRYCVKSQNSLKWDTGDNIPEINTISFIEKSNIIPIYIKISSFYEQPFDYKKAQNVKCEGKLLVQHKPLNVNFWHFQFLVIDEDGNEINSNRSEWKKEALMQMNTNLKIQIENNLKTKVFFYRKCPSKIYRNV